MNFVAVAIVFAIVLGHPFNKRTDFGLVQISFLFVLITVAKSPNRNTVKIVLNLFLVK